MKANEDLKLSAEWKAMYRLSKGIGLKANIEPQLTANFNQKINWFLKGGASGVLILIHDVFGHDSVHKFYDFLDYYLSKPDSSGHYHYSDSIQDRIKDMKIEMQGITFEKYLDELTQELIEKDELKGSIKNGKKRSSNMAQNKSDNL